MKLLPSSIEAIQRLQQHAATLVAALIVGMALAWGYGQQGNLFGSWDLLGVPRMPPPNLPFTDTISVTHSVDCFRAGFDPYRTGRCDPWNRLFNYPPVWLELRHVGVSSAITDALGAWMAALTAAAFLLVFRTRSWPGFLIAVLALLSPAILFGLERGNVDTLLFSALVFGLFGSGRLGESPKQAIRGLLVIGLTVLKAYPIAACSVLIGRTKRSWLTALGFGIIAFAVFALSSWNAIIFIFENTPLTSFYSYGSAPLFLDLDAYLKISGLDKSQIRKAAASVAFLLGLMPMAWMLIKHRHRSSKLFPFLVGGELPDDLCLACLSVFCLSFLLGSNFNYRLIFLVGVLSRVIKAYDETQLRQTLVMSSAIVALFWAAHLPSLVNYALQWAVYIGACAWLAEALLSRCSGDRQDMACLPTERF